MVFQESERLDVVRFVRLAAPPTDTAKLLEDGRTDAVVRVARAAVDAVDAGRAA